MVGLPLWQTTKYHLAAAASPVVDSSPTRAITSLLINGTLAKNPNIRWIFSHGGGATPMMAGRMAETVGHRSNAAEVMPNGLLAELRKLYYDTASAASPASMAALLIMAPTSHILNALLLWLRT
jgi:predicted TIM-barrel fold metal-dependent hydrolase